MQSAVQQFCNSLFTYVTGKDGLVGLLVKKHSENFKTHGEFSFPNTIKSWYYYLNSEHFRNSGECALLLSLGITTEDLIKESQEWILKVRKAVEVNDRVYIFLDRTQAVRVGLLEAIQNNVFIGIRLKEHKVCCINVDDSTSNDNITFLRLIYLSKVIQNLCCLSDVYKEEQHNIFLTSKSSRKFPKDNKVVLLCGTVLNSKTSLKEVIVTSDEFIRQRQNEMTLIAQHKYGVRVSSDTKWKEFIDHLGESAAAFELLQTKPNCVVKINFDTSTGGSSKGAAFILYNCARLETIIKTYNEKVTEGIYPELPKIEDIDFNLLSHEDEWSLIFNYVMGLPALLSSCTEITDDSCNFKPHYICNYLCSMVQLISKYYRKVRILTEPRQHLLPVLFARIHMIKILNDTLKTCLTILNIKSVSQMYIPCFIPICNSIFYTDTDSESFNTSLKGYFTCKKTS